MVAGVEVLVGQIGKVYVKAWNVLELVVEFVWCEVIRNVLELVIAFVWFEVIILA